LLDRLGEPDDTTVLESARALHRMVTEAGASWDELLRSELDVDQAEDEASGDVAAKEMGGELSEAERNEAHRLIERLLTRGSLSDTLREDLGDLKSGLADGSFEAMDLRYVRALAKRLGV
jgi:hypothetical protein